MQKARLESRIVATVLCYEAISLTKDNQFRLMSNRL